MQHTIFLQFITSGGWILSKPQPRRVRAHAVLASGQMAVEQEVGHKKIASVSHLWKAQSLEGCRPYWSPLIYRIIILFVAQFIILHFFSN